MCVTMIKMWKTSLGRVGSDRSVASLFIGMVKSWKILSVGSGRIGRSLRSDRHGQMVGPHSVLVCASVLLCASMCAIYVLLCASLCFSVFLHASLRPSVYMCFTQRPARHEPDMAPQLYCQSGYAPSPLRCCFLEMAFQKLSVKRT